MTSPRGAVLTAADKEVLRSALAHPLENRPWREWLAALLASHEELERAMIDRQAQVERVVAAIEERIDLIRATAPDVVPGGYQVAYADGLTSAIAEIRAVFTPGERGDA